MKVCMFHLCAGNLNYSVSHGCQLAFRVLLSIDDNVIYGVICEGKLWNDWLNFEMTCQIRLRNRDMHFFRVL